MKKISKLFFASALLIGSFASAPAFAHGGAGGGGWPNSPAAAKAKAIADAHACKLDSTKCVGFGTHYYGQ